MTSYGITKNILIRTGGLASRGNNIAYDSNVARFSIIPNVPVAYSLLFLSKKKVSVVLAVSLLAEAGS